MSNSKNSDGEISTYCGHTFAMLDKWLIRIGNENNPEESSKIVKRAFQNNIKANISYYEYLEKAAEESHRKKMAATNRLIANLYKGSLAS